MEMDLRKPKLSKILKVKKTPGISSYLAEKASVDEITKQTEIPGLYVISAGPIPPNPTELIQGERFEELMAEIKTRFDYVIMDTAPVSPVTDAQLLQKFADINLFIIRHGVTPRVFLSMIGAVHKQKKFKNVSLVFNGVKPRGFNILRIWLWRLWQWLWLWLWLWVWIRRRIRRWILSRGKERT